MPQMSPLSWTTLALMLMFMSLIIMNTMKSSIPKMELKHLMKKKENKMKW